MTPAHSFEYGHDDTSRRHDTPAGLDPQRASDGPRGAKTRPDTCAATPPLCFPPEHSGYG